METLSLDSKSIIQKFISGMQIPNPIIISDPSFRKVYKESREPVKEMLYNFKVPVFDDLPIYSITHDQILECVKECNLSSPDEISEFKYLILRLKPVEPIRIKLEQAAIPNHNYRVPVFYETYGGLKRVRFKNPFKLCIKNKHFIESRILKSCLLSAESAFKLFEKLVDAGSSIILVNFEKYENVLFEFHPLKFTEKDLYILNDVLTAFACENNLIYFTPKTIQNARN